jgi:hypothetical protein
VSSPTGATFGQQHGIVFDSQGVAQPPQRPYPIIEQYQRMYRTGWASLDELNASLQTAPPAGGLPDGAPSPNAVFLEDGMLVRYVIDPDVKREPFVQDGAVNERIQFRRQYVALTLEGARAATDKRNIDEGEPETDFWCGYTWIRGGYSAERTFPVMVQARQEGRRGSELVFNAPMSPTDAARIRHEVAHMDRTSPTLPVETSQASGMARPSSEPKRGRPPKAATSTPDTTAGETPPAEDER